jgi:hypothetical protein
VILWRAEHRAVEHDPPQEQVKVVFPRHADSAVQLNAVLQHARRVLADIGFRDADGHFSVGGAACDFRNGGIGRSPTCLEPDLQIGILVFEHLVRPDRATERVPVEAPRNGELQHGIQDADDLGALKYLSDLALAGDQLRSLLRGADDRRGLDLHTVERHPRISLHEIDRLLRFDPHAGRIRRHEKLSHGAIAIGDHE